ncbi:hypothetical protein GQR58_008035 [Nymphon striatum]|nr:hypothetical protein GQR58_008035 [Nymphon striatum]
MEKSLFSKQKSIRLHATCCSKQEIENGRCLFAHMLLVAQNRKLKMEDVLSHLLGPLPMALASPDGLMRTTNKSSLGHELQNNVVPAANIPQPCCCIIDGMALVQKMRVKEWQEEKHRKKLNDKSLFVTRGKLCYHVTSSGTQIASDLESTQKEADIRMLLHAAHASRSDYEAIVVVSDDTDVLVLCLTFKPPIPTKYLCKLQTCTNQTIRTDNTARLNTAQAMDDSDSDEE